MTARPQARRTGAPPLTLAVVLVTALTLAATAVPGLANVGYEPPPHVLVYSGTNGFRHASIGRAQDVLARAGIGGAYTITYSEDPGILSDQTLAETDVVLWLSSTGSTSPFTDSQEQAYEDWLGCGGGHVGIHASADSWRDGSWPAWEELTGAFIAGHPITATSAADDSFTAHEGFHPVVHAPEAGVDYVEGDGEPEAEIGIAAADHPTTQAWAGQPSFLHRDEYYYFDRDPAELTSDYQALLTFEGFTEPDVDAVWGSNFAEHMPLAWAGSFRGNGRTFYTNLGHGVATWDVPEFVDHVKAGILWAADAPTPEECA